MADSGDMKMLVDNLCNPVENMVLMQHVLSKHSICHIRRSQCVTMIGISLK